MYAQDVITCSQACNIANSLANNTSTTETYTVAGYVTSIVNVNIEQYGDMTFWMADSPNGGQVLEAYRVNTTVAVNVGDYVSVTATLKKYVTGSNVIYETDRGTLQILTKVGKSGIYLRGEINDWSVDSAYEFNVGSNGEYYLENITLSGEFKIADATWSDINLGSNGNAIKAGEEYFLQVETDDNIQCGFESMNCTKITLDLYNYTLLLEGEAIPLPQSTYTVRLDPYSVDWSSAYAYVWTGNASASYAYKTYSGNSGYNADPVVWAQQAQIDEEGWFAVSFQLEEGETYHFGWMENTNNSYPSPTSYILTYLTGSVCAEFNSNGRLQATTCKNLMIDESNSYTIHVATAGTFGQVLVQAMGTNTWTDVLALTVTGTMNEDDMQYLGRMTNLQILDLSGTNITNIGECQNLAKLSSVSLPATCVAINDNAFNGCKRLSSINLESIEQIGNSAFYQCQNLTSLNMPNVLSVGNDAFEMSSNSSLQTVNMPIVQSIGDYAFKANQNLASITMPLVTTIGQGAFLNCNALAQVDLSNVTNLGERAFCMDMSSNYSGNLESVLLSDELEIIPYQCFNGCNKLTSITFPFALKEIGQKALPSLTSVQLPAGVQIVESGNFTNATTVSIPSSTISWESFSNTWTDVYCYVISPQYFSVFNTSEVANMTLHVPSISMAAYRLHDNWYQFGQILPIEGNISELNINGEFLLSTTNGIADNANMTINDGAGLTMSADLPLELGNYTQMIGSFARQYYKDYHYDNNNRYVQYYYSDLPYTGMLLANSPMTADAVSVKFVLRANKWNFFSLPFDVNMSDITIGTEGSGTIGSSQWVIREYSGANRASGNGATWNNVPANGVLQAHKGYILYWLVEGSSSYINNANSNYYSNNNPLLYYFNLPAANNANKQDIFSTGDVNVSLTEYSAEFPQNRSWNLVGNPYPCSFDIQQMDFEAPITTWNGNGYIAYSPLDDSYMLRPAEGFFVQAPKGVNQITFHKEGRSVVNYMELSLEEYNNARNNAPRRTMTSNVTRKVFNFTLSDDNYSDRVRLVLNEEASVDYELTRDAAKMMSSDNSVPQLYVNDNGLRYAIDERPEQNNYTLGAYFGKAGEYTLHLNVPENEDRQIYVTDTETQITTDLTMNDYSFTTNAGTYDSRFVISFVQRMPTGIENADQLIVPMKTIENGQLIITTPQGKKYTVGGKAL